MVSKPLHRRKNFRIFQSTCKYTLNSYQLPRQPEVSAGCTCPRIPLGPELSCFPRTSFCKNKFALTSHCPGISPQLSLQCATVCTISTGVNNVVSVMPDDFHQITGEGSGHQDRKWIFPLSLSVLRPNLVFLSKAVRDSRWQQRAGKLIFQQRAINIPFVA